MTSAVWVGQARVWVGHGLPGLIARTASGYRWCTMNVYRMSLEMDLMSPFLLRQTAAVSNVYVNVTSLNRVQLDRPAMSKVRRPIGQRVSIALTIVWSKTKMAIYHRKTRNENKL